MSEWTQIHWHLKNELHLKVAAPSFLSPSAIWSVSHLFIKRGSKNVPENLKLIQSQEVMGSLSNE